jgi:hypothetical protein
MPQKGNKEISWVVLSKIHFQLIILFPTSYKVLGIFYFATKAQILFTR